MTKESTTEESPKIDDLSLFQSALSDLSPYLRYWIEKTLSEVMNSSANCESGWREKFLSLLIYLCQKEEEGALCHSISEMPERLNAFTSSLIEQEDEAEAELATVSQESVPVFDEKFFQDLPEKSPTAVVRTTTRAIDAGIKVPLFFYNDQIYLAHSFRLESHFLHSLENRLSQNPFGSAAVGRREERERRVLLSDEKMSELTSEWNSLSRDTLKRVVESNFLLITGGPGTGKTTLLAHLLKALSYVYHTGDHIESHIDSESLVLPEIRLVSPTGRGAARMKESLRERYPSDPLLSSLKSQTVHSLLKLQPTKSSPYTQSSPLYCDFVIVDEASMLDIYLWIQLLDGLPVGCKLILLGDVNQLPSIETGAILGDLTLAKEESSYRLKENVVTLSVGYRSKAEISELAQKVLKEPESSFDFLQRGSQERADESADKAGVFALPFPSTFKEMLSLIIKEYREIELSLATQEIPPQGFYELDEEKKEEIFGSRFDFLRRIALLTPQRVGAWGTQRINDALSRLLSPQRGTWSQTPVMITVNQFKEGLFNGDLGWLFSRGVESFFLFSIDSEYKIFPPYAIRGYEVAYARTIHKSQGSEFETVFLLLPDASPTLSRELLYTGITRAKNRLVVLANETGWREAVSHQIARNSAIQTWTTENSVDPS